ncbi:hypothetical protein CDO44_16505 [Pigmentiphaga sp. NML080357]|uniref:DUF883 family protein n=1 Tax=Pigmentiphaga sp. NML080357 TaxID=2008675 RepID=UPI000B409BB6|nr:DUF883 family protein [Pigmentiphaga sp. NML080357]OVZ57976.1 hypothetical protein CDO44_16505 [Pigmentiphaga sp. NML080357]
MGSYSGDWLRGKDRAVDHVRGVVEDAEALLKTTAGYTSQELEAARRRLHDELERARELYHEAQRSAVDSYRQASAHTDAYVRDNPWRAVGIAAAVGVVIGLLAMRR